MGIKLYMVVPMAFFIAVGAIVFGCYLSEWVFLSVIAFALILISFKILFKRKIGGLALCFALFLVFSFYSMGQNEDNGVLENFENKEAVVYCKIIGEESQTGFYIAKIIAISDGGNLIKSNEKCEIKIGAEDNALFYGDLVRLRAEVDKTLSLSKRAKGITHSLKANGIKKLSSFERISDALDLSYCIRSYIKTVLCNMLDNKSAAVVMGVLISDKTNLDFETQEILQSSGIMHICVASGMHVNCIMSAIAFALAGMGVKRKYFLFILMPVILFYAFLNNWSSPIIRAGIAAFIFQISFGAKRDYDPFIALCFSGIVILLCSPFKIS